MLCFTLSKISLQEKSCSQGMENKRVHDLYCSLIFKDACHTVIKCFLMYQEIQSAPRLPLAIGFIAAMFLCFHLLSNDHPMAPWDMGRPAVVEGWRSIFHLPRAPPQHLQSQWEGSISTPIHTSPRGNVVSSGLPSIIAFSGKISHIVQLCPPEIQTFERPQNSHELS